MRSTVIIIVILTILASCRNDGETGKTTTGVIRSIAFGEGIRYKVNPFTHENIDTSEIQAVTGELFTIDPLVISSDTMPPAEIIPAPEPEITDSEANTTDFVQPGSVRAKWQGSGNVVRGFRQLKNKPHIFVKPSVAKAGSPFFRDNSLYNLSYLDVDQGLKSPYIRAILKQSDGRIWMGLFNGGLCRYNGKQFEYFASPLEMTTVNYLTEDDEGNIWIASWGQGVYCYDGFSFKDYKVEFVHPKETVNSLRKAGKGVIIATDKNIIYRIEDGKIETIDPAKSLKPGENIGSAEITDKGEIVFVTDQSVYRVTGSNIARTGNLAGEATIFGLFKDPEQNMWITHSRGAIQLSGNYFRNYSAENGLSGNEVTAVKKIEDGSLYFGTLSGLEIVSEGKVTKITTSEGLTNDLITDICDDENGNIWLATNGGGVCIFRRNSFEHFTDQNGLTNYLIKSISVQNRKELWLGAFPGDLVEVRDGKFVHYQNSREEHKLPVYAVAKDKNGGLWYNEWKKALYYKSGNQLTKYTSVNGFPEQVRDILIDKSGNIWLATIKGVYKITDPGKANQRIHHFSEKNGLVSDRVMDIEQDEKGGIWIATEGGLCHFPDRSKNELIQYSKKEGLLNAIIICLKFHNNILYFGTDGGGIGMLSGKELRVISEPEGLSSSNVVGISFDDKDRMWVSTTGGLNVLFPGTNRKIIPFGKADGLKAGDFYRGANCVDYDQNLWIGSGKGLTRIDLKKWELSSQKPLVFIDAIRINGEELVPEKNVVRKEGVRFGNRPKRAELSYDQNRITFHFSAVDWSSPNGLKYSFRIRNHSETWSEWSEEAVADLRGLTDGEYVFEVRSVNKSGVIGNPQKFPFSIAPPWWKTWWAYGIFLLIFIFLIQVITKFRTRRLEIKQRELESIVESRTIELQVEKEKVTEKNNEILDSITYAKRIQDAILPGTSVLNELLPGSMIYYLPKDIVAGDFYWLQKDKNLVWFAIADCTGHGVPGAIVSVVCSNALNKALENSDVTTPGELLNSTRKLVGEMFAKSGKDVKDGMDISLCAWNKAENKLLWSGANNPLWIVRNRQLLEWKPSKQPIGKFEYASDFETQEIRLERDDLIVLFTDGFQDQFGGDRKKKLKVAGWRSLILELSEINQEDQHSFVEKWFADWKNGEEQLDDVCLLTWKYKLKAEAIR